MDPQKSDPLYFKWSNEKLQKLANLRNDTVTAPDPSVHKSQKRTPGYLWQVEDVAGTKSVRRIIAVPFADACLTGA